MNLIYQIVSYALQEVCSLKKQNSYRIYEENT